METSYNFGYHRTELQALFDVLDRGASRLMKAGSSPFGVCGVCCRVTADQRQAVLAEFLRRTQAGDVVKMRDLAACFGLSLDTVARITRNHRTVILKPRRK